MSVYNIVFSPTGGTKRVAEIFLKSFCTESTYIDLCDRTIDFSGFLFDKDSTCIISVPSYGGRVPETAISRLRQMKGNKANAILIVVYGNRAYEDTFVELQDSLEECGFLCIAAIAAIAEHSIMHQFAAGRPDLRDEQEISSFAVSVRSKIESQKLDKPLNLPGNRPYKDYGGVPMKPKAGKKCSRCGICAKECPVGAIQFDNPSLTDDKKCISCMRCIAVCPQNVRSINKALLAAGSMKLKKACSGHKNNELFL